MKVDSKFSLKDKTCLITGACGLLGKEHAVALLQTGCKVILTDIVEKDLDKTKEELSKDWDLSDIYIHKMDVTKQDDVEGVSKSILESGLHVDILINNASINPKINKESKPDSGTRLEDFDLNQWHQEISVGLTGAFICSKIFGSLMAKKETGGVILNIASDLSVIAPDQRLYFDKNKLLSDQQVKPVTYSVVKTGLIGLTRYLSTYWIGKNIRSNALSPGGVFDGQDKELSLIHI